MDTLKPKRKPERVIDGMKQRAVDRGFVYRGSIVGHEFDDRYGLRCLRLEQLDIRNRIMGSICMPVEVAVRMAKDIVQANEQNIPLASTDASGPPVNPPKPEAAEVAEPVAGVLRAFTRNLQ